MAAMHGNGSDDTNTPGPHAASACVGEEPPRLPRYAEQVLEVVEVIPAGRVLTYGDIAEWLSEGGPRQVGRVMALYGGGVPWWRVVRADGVLLAGQEREALAAYRAEGTPLRLRTAAAADHTPRLDLARARWDGEEAPDGRGSAASSP